MTQLNRFACGLLLALFSTQVVAQEAEIQDSRAGEGKAVEKLFKDGSFRLAPEAQKTIGLKLEEVQQVPRIVTKATLVYFGDKVGVYRLRDGLFKLVEVKAARNSGAAFVITSPDLMSADKIVTEGVPLLRVSEMDAFGGEG